MSIDIFADYLITKPDSEAGDNITHLKLQKLLYYAQGWHLALYGEPLFEEHFEAWAHGPVAPVVYHRFKEYGAAPIPISEALYADEVNEEEAEFLDELWDVYGDFSAKKLKELSHQEAPWLLARGNRGAAERCTEIITHESMARFFKSIR